MTEQKIHIPMPEHPIWKVPGFEYLRWRHPVADKNGFRFHQGGLFPVHADQSSSVVVGAAIIDGNKAPFVIKAWSSTTNYDRRRSYIKARIRLPDGTGERTDF